jgi:hypothetical protein
MYGERCIQAFGGENWGEQKNFEDPGIDGRIILSWIFRKWDLQGDMDLIVLV